MRTSARRSGWRRWTRRSTGRLRICRTPVSRSSAAGTARATSPRTSCSTTRRSAAKAYEAWLRSQGVRYVLLPDAQPDYSALNEARLIRSGKTSLVPVFRSAHVIVYQLPGATPLITGAGDASVLWLYPTHIVALVDGPGRYEVRVRWSPYWRVIHRLRVARPRRDAPPARSARRARRSARVGQRHPRSRDAHRADAPPGVREMIRGTHLTDDRRRKTARGSALRARRPARLGPGVPLTRFHSRSGS